MAAVRAAALSRGECSGSPDLVVGLRWQRRPTRRGRRVWRDGRCGQVGGGHRAAVRAPPALDFEADQASEEPHQERARRRYRHHWGSPSRTRWFMVVAMSCLPSWARARRPATYCHGGPAGSEVRCGAAGPRARSRFKGWRPAWCGGHRGLRCCSPGVSVTAWRSGDPEMKVTGVSRCQPTRQVSEYNLAGVRLLCADER